MNHEITRRGALSAGAALMLPAIARAADTSPVKIGLIIPLTGASQSTGVQLQAAAKLYMQQHGATVAGRPIELIVRDDAGVADNTRRIAQELVVRDKVAVLAGFGLTPLALSAAPIATQGKVPMVVMVAATSSVIDATPYAIRVAQVIGQPSVILADWAVKNGVHKVVTLVSDYGPGVDSEKWFTDRFKQGGGEVLASLRVPLANPDFAPFLQRVRDLAPDALFAFVPSGVGGVLVRQFVERGMDKSGIRFIGTGDVTDDDQLNGMGDVVQGMITAGPYSANHDSALNKTFVAEFRKANNNMRPNFVACFGYDGMALIYQALTATKGDSSGPALLEAMKTEKWESPRGPVAIDPATRDIVQDIYIRKVERTRWWTSSTTSSSPSSTPSTTLPNRTSDAPPLRHCEEPPGDQAIQGNTAGLWRAALDTQRRHKLAMTEPPYADQSCSTAWRMACCCSSSPCGLSVTLGRDEPDQPRPWRLRHGRRLHAAVVLVNRMPACRSSPRIAPGLRR